MLFNLNNVKLLIGTTALSYVVFALLYTLAYRLTSNAYYQIVSGAREDWTCCAFYSAPPRA